MKQQIFIRIIMVLLFMGTVFQTELQARDNFIGYFTRWHKRGTNRNYYEYLRNLDFSMFSHVVYCFIVPADDGTLHEPFDDTLMSILVEKGHEAGAKVLLGFAGGAGESYDPDVAMYKICNDPAALETFVDTLLSKVRYWNLDGLDNDWEPHWETRATRLEPYEMLMELLADSLSAMDKMLMADVYLNRVDNSHLSQRSIDLMEIVGLMTYENNFGPGYAEDIREAVHGWSSYVDPERINLTLPLWGRKPWSWGGGRDYKDIIQYDSTAFYRDSIVMYGDTLWNYGPVSNRKLVKMVQDETLAGVGFWAPERDCTGVYAQLPKLSDYADTLNGKTAIVENSPVKLGSELTIIESGQQVHFSLGGSSGVSLKLHSLNGKEILTVLGEGESINLNTQALSPGIYLYQFTGGSQQISGKLSLIQ